MNVIVSLLIGLIVGYVIGIGLAVVVAFVFGFEDVARFLAIGCGLLGATLMPWWQAHRSGADDRYQGWG